MILTARNIGMILRCAFALLCLLPAVEAQTAPSPKLEFDVASVKPNTGEGKMSMARFAPGGRLTAENISTKFLIRMAYEVDEAQISGGPGWLGSDHYDVNARAPEGQTSTPEMRRMLQALLADRFNLALHRESKEAQVYELRAAKGGARLASTKEGSCITPDRNNPPPQLQPGEKPPAFCGMVRMGRGLIDANGTDMAQVIRVLSQILGKTVVDKDRLHGPGGYPSDVYSR